MIPSIRSIACVAMGSAVLLALNVDARVTKITVDSKTTLFGGRTFGNVGAYEQIKGTVSGELDPNDRRNNLITDIAFAPRNPNGRVEYQASYTIYKPIDMTKASGVMTYEVVNRGNHILVSAGLGGSTPQNAGDPGDGLLYRDGHMYLWSGWQGDLPQAATTPAQEWIAVPTAKAADGSSITGPVFARFVNIPLAGTPAVRQTTQSLPGTILNNAVLGRAPATTDTTKATLISKVSETQSGVSGGVVTLASTDWAFADCRTVPFPGTPDATRICLRNGFDPDLLYQLVYTAKDPLVLGVGMAAMRDVNSFFRYAAVDDAGTANPIAGKVTKSIGYGISQSGRYLKAYLNLGFNEDEVGRMVWDGVDADAAGQMGQFNIRFAIPGNIANLYEPGADGPLWWSDYTDSVRGRPAWGILHRCAQTSTCPKIFETYGGPEYWYSRGTPGLVGTGAAADLPLPSNVRRYYIASTPHALGPGGFNLGTPSTNPNNLANNPNPLGETLRALYIALVDWVQKNVEPPASVYPRLSDGTLVAATSAAMGWPNIPNTPKPDGVINSLLDYDFGPNFRYNDESGVMDIVPPNVKQVIPTLVPKVDADGNEIAGIRTLLVQMPLGTYTSWNPYPSGVLKGQEASLAAGYIPFAKTRADRQASGDPRVSIAERYPNLWAYYYNAIGAANDLVAQRYLLPEDANYLLNQILNNMLTSGLLPKRGAFARGFEPFVDDGFVMPDAELIRSLLAQ